MEGEEEPPDDPPCLKGRYRRLFTSRQIRFFSQNPISSSDL